MFKTTQSRVIATLSLSFIVLILVTVWVILLFVSPQLKNTESMMVRYELGRLSAPIVEQMNRVKAQIRSITQSVAVMDSDHIDHLLPSLVDQYQDVNVFGGDIWPLPEKRQAGRIKFSTFYARNNDNKLMVNTYWNSPESDNYFEQAWYKGGMGAPKGECVWANAYQDDASPMPRTNCAMPIYKNDAVYGVATIDVTLGFFNQLAQAMGNAIQGKVLIVEDNGKIVGDETNLTAFKGLQYLKDVSASWPAAPHVTELMSQLSQTDDNVMQSEFSVNGIDHTIMLNRIPGSPWLIVSDMRSDLLTQQTDSILSRLGMVQMPMAFLLLLFMLVFIRRQMKLLAGLNKNIHGLSADGADLTRRLSLSKSPEFNGVINGFNHVMIFLQDTLKQVSDSSQSISAASQQIASGNQDLSLRTSEQAESVEQTVSAMDAIMGKVNQNAENAANANQLAETAAKLAGEGVDVVSNAVATMNNIQTASQRIVDIISVIDGIAFQTNILALNAAVEAARAGEQGRGFAVVASEVRNLAQRSAQSSKEIKDLIENSVASINSGTEQVHRVGDTMNKLTESVNNVTRLMADIMSSSQEQRSDIGQVNEGLAKLDTSTQQNSKMVSDVSALAQALRESAKNLEQVVGSFKF